MILKELIKSLISIPFHHGNLISTFRRYPKFFKQLKSYRSGSSERVELRNINPQLNDETTVTPFDPHYFHQSAWCARRIASRKVKRHVDVASQINLIAPLSAFVEVEFIDYRPLHVSIDNLTSRAGSILNLPFKDRSVKSLSSLHVIEHIGLGRYGDSLDPEGSKKACKELQRIIAVNGDLYLSTPVGQERVEFNAHRIHSPDTILHYCDELSLVEFSYVDDNGTFVDNGSPADCVHFHYGLGMFHFRRLKK